METKEIKSCIKHKIVELADFKAVETDGILEISGYANTKYIADRYGDIPTPYNRDYVYDLTEYRKNPIILLNHDADIKNVAGSCVEISEDERGLYIRARLTQSDLPIMKHARTLIKERHLKTFSIGGRFYYENPQNPNQLTLAEIYEISIVAVPADPNALFNPTEEKAAIEEVKETKQEEKEIDFKPLAKKIALFEIKQKLEKARKLSGKGVR